jgi:hypothetical protein
MKVDNKSTMLEVLGLATQLNHEDRERFVMELIKTLEIERLENILTEIKSTIAIQRASSKTEVFIDSQPKIEIKNISGKFYAYLRSWEANTKQLKSKYLGAMPFQEGHVYKLSGKSGDVKSEAVKTLTSKGLYLREDKIFLLIEHLTPKHEMISHSYPDCIKTEFSKKDWTIEHLSSTVNSTPPEFQSLNKQLEILVQKEFSPQIIRCLQQWEVLSHSLPIELQWTFTFKSNNILLTNHQQEIIIQYSTITQSLKTQKSVYALLTWLQNISWEASNCKGSVQENKAVAQRLFSRLQNAPQNNSIQLFRFLFDLL